MAVSEKVQANKPSVPIVIVLDLFAGSVIVPYVESVITTLQAVHPSSQLLVTALRVNDKEPIAPQLVPPQTFLNSLSAILTEPTTATSIWRPPSILDSIKLAKKRIEVHIADSQPGLDDKLPKYIVVISSSDFDESENDSNWREECKAFYKGVHDHTLFSLIAIEPLPLLEQFWKGCASRFPGDLQYNSMAPTTSDFHFPLLSSSHATMLLGFYYPNVSGSNAGNKKRPAPASRASTEAVQKKARPNGPTTSASASTVPTSLPPPAVPPSASPPINMPSTLPPQPLSLPGGSATQNLNEAQAAFLAYSQKQTNVQPRPTIPPTASAPSNVPTSQQQQPRTTWSISSIAASLPFDPLTAAPSVILRHLKADQVAVLPQVPQELRAKIEGYINSIKANLQKGTTTQAEAAGHMKKLAELANEHRVKMFQEAFKAEKAARERSMSGASSSSSSHFSQSTANTTPATSVSSHAAAPPDPNERPLLWKGSIVLELSSPQGRNEFTMHVTGFGMQTSAVRSLAGVQLPAEWRISALVPSQMATLQDVVQKHSLPALSLKPVPEQMLRPDQRATDPKRTNEAMYLTFAKALDTRANAGIVRFPGTNNHGVILMSTKETAKLVAIVFTKVPIPPAFLSSSAQAGASAPKQPQQQPMSRVAPTQAQQQSIPRQQPAPTQAYVSPNLNMSPQLGSNGANLTSYPPMYNNTLPGNSGTFNATFQAMQQQQQQQQQQAQQQAQSQQPVVSNDFLGGGMSFEQLSALVGGQEQLAKLLSGSS